MPLALEHELGGVEFRRGDRVLGDLSVLHGQDGKVTRRRNALILRWIFFGNRETEVPISGAMKTWILVAMVCGVLGGCGGWSKRDTIAELGFAAVTAEDWRETRTITSFCNETNPVLGPCGENMPVDLYFPVAIALHAAVAAMLPPKWRLLWQGVAIGAELNQVWSNYAMRWWEPYVPPAARQRGEQQRSTPLRMR